MQKTPKRKSPARQPREAKDDHVPSGWAVEATLAELARLLHILRTAWAGRKCESVQILDFPEERTECLPDYLVSAPCEPYQSCVDLSYIPLDVQAPTEGQAQHAQSATAKPFTSGGAPSTQS